MPSAIVILRIFYAYPMQKRMKQLLGDTVPTNLDGGDNIAMCLSFAPSEIEP